ncbi:MAG: hypothetical protein AAFQ43_08085, partial [Bacteroidota bacterium]
MRFALPLFLLLSLASGASGQPWPSTQWSIVCYEPYQEALDSVTSTPQSPTICDDSDPDQYISTVREALERASGRLSAAGYRPPVMGQEESRWRSVFYGDHVEAPCGERSGCYEPEGTIVGEPSLFFGLTTYIDKPAAHELFHAVQAAYLDPAIFDGSGREGSAYGWITEGIAESVGLMLSDETGGTRSYSRPLHQPGGVVPQYDTAEFWTFAAIRARGFDALGAFAPVMSAITPDGTGLQGVDAGLREAGAEGLAEVFRSFVAQEATSPAYFTELGTLTARGPLPVAESVERTVEPVAADAVAVTAVVPAGATNAQVSISLDGSPDLTLVVDSQIRDLGFSEFASPGEHSYFVRVVNVADDPAASREQAYTL